ncbi:hypothetical protein [Rhodococcus pyridinivorans]|uniref:Uncharacterized protein n=1 Tax=Rhodococcus pyridinivorans AK37 TaxID=1114960 RepID=H0JV50_9NOCA|nr:hypothetical protein [Rhodococcus pyridinivorans]EHK82146.1 hypothetical protein AK37_17905 [Rhodococcus pyridinivorans AK37]MCD2140403.1 hypothetical protein [Rhodococcus pyridinivorans]
MKLTRKRRKVGPVEEARERRDSALRRLRGAPAPVIDQDEQRRRRRQWLPVHYTGAFDLTEEVSELLAPLAQRSDIARYPHLVHELATAVHHTRLDLEQLLVDRDARRRISDLPYEKRGRARDLIIAAWERPTAPVIDPTSAWADQLVDHVVPLTEPLRDYLARATPPGQTGNNPSISERVETALREVDRAVVSVTRTLNHIEANRTTSSTVLTPQLRALAPSADELEALGLT